MMVICDLCFPNAKVVGSLASEYYLMENEGRYYLIQEPCHKDHIIYSFINKPVRDPDPNCTGEVDNEDWMTFLHEVWKIKWHMRDAYNITQWCIDNGWSQEEDGMVDTYLAAKLGEMVT